jgi:hypothetical protein
VTECCAVVSSFLMVCPVFLWEHFSVKYSDTLSHVVFTVLAGWGKLQYCGV